MEAYGHVVRAWGSMTDWGPCIRYGGKKIENFFFVSYDVKMILSDNEFLKIKMKVLVIKIE